MALLQLSLVTEGLLALVKTAVTGSHGWSAGIVLDASPDPPDRLGGEHTVGLYLYHATEDPHRRNVPAPGEGGELERESPFPLLLHYLLTAHSDLGEGQGTFQEQLIMGLAMKALRDFPVLDDDTVVFGVNPMPASLRGHGNRFRITAQAVSPTDAIAYWTAGQHALRMSAYYEVGVALLEPEPVQRRSARVLSYAVRTLVRGAPRLSGSRSTQTFLPPLATAPVTVELKPAEAAIGDAIELFGTALAGEETVLSLQHPSWRAPIAVDPLQWGIVAAPDRIAATVQADAGGEPLLAGVYAASVSVAGDGVRASSNVTPFMVAPAVTAVSAVDGAGRVVVNGGRFDPALLPDDAIQVYLGTARLARIDAGATIRASSASTTAASSSSGCPEACRRARTCPCGSSSAARSRRRAGWRSRERRRRAGAGARRRATDTGARTRVRGAAGRVAARRLGAGGDTGRGARGRGLARGG